MQRFQGNFQDDDGNALSAATCYVYEYVADDDTTTLATIYSSYAGAGKSNPFTLNSTADIDFYAADGRYTIKLTKSGYTDKFWNDIQLLDGADVKTLIDGAADGVQYYWDTVAERSAEVGMTTGDLGMMTNTTSNKTAGVVGYVYQYSGAAWVFVYARVIIGTIWTEALDMGDNHTIRSRTIGDQQIGPYAQFFGDANMTAADNINLNFATYDFAILIRCKLDTADPTSAETLLRKYTTLGIAIYQDPTTNKFSAFLSDGSTTGTIYEDVAGGDGCIHKYMIRGDRDGLTDLFKDGKQQTTTITSPPLTMTNVGDLNIGSYSSVEYLNGGIFEIAFFNRRPTDVEAVAFTANPQKTIVAADHAANQTALTSGTLEIGRRYFIDLYVASDDFTNVGASSNATGVEFVATGTTPTTWTNSSSLRHTGCMGLWTGFSLIDDTTWQDVMNSNHFVNSSALILNQTNQSTPKEGTWVPANGDFGTWTSPTFTAKYKKLSGQVTISLEQTGGTIDPGAAGKYFTGVPYTPSNIATGQASSAVFADHGAIFLKADGKIYFSDDFGPVTDLAFSITYPTDE